MRGARAFLHVLVGVFLLTLFSTPARATWQTFAAQDGLASNTLLCLLEDHSGNLWFGTWRGGLSRYDGVTWTTFDTTNGLAGMEVLSAMEDRGGRLWFATGNGVSRWDGSAWSTFTTADGLQRNGVSAMIQDRRGNYWFACPRWGGTAPGGVSRWDGNRWTTYTPADGLASDEVKTIVEDHAGTLWFGTDGGVSRFDGSNWTSYLPEEVREVRNVTAMIEDRAGTLWIGTSGYGAIRYDGVTWTPVDGLTSGAVESIFEDDNGAIWFATNGGLRRWDGSSWRTFTAADGLAASDVRQVLEDRSGNLWFAHGTDGTTRWDRVEWITYLADRRIEHVYQDRRGVMWFVTACAGVVSFDGQAWRTYRPWDGLARDCVTDILEDRSGALWFTSFGGATRYDGTTWSTFTTADGLVSDYVISVGEDRDGNLWFGTWGAGVSRYDGTTWRTFTTADGLAADDVWAIHGDSAGNVWFGTDEGGVSRFDGGGWRTFTTADGLAGAGVRAIHEDRAGRILVATGYGASWFDGTGWSSLTPAQGLSDRFVNDVRGDRRGDLWIATQDGGVNRWNGETVASLRRHDGLPAERVYCTFEDRDGFLWFGTESGVARHWPDLVPPGTVISPRPAAVSGSRAQTITFQAAFGEADGVHFSHSFDGSAWSTWSPVGFWQTNGLADGSHTFAVRARDRIGNVDPTPDTSVFLVDATAPAPVIRSPAAGQAVRDSIVIRGSASDLRFRSFRVETRPSGTNVWTPLAEAVTPGDEGILAGWNTRLVADGEWELRVSVTDTLGLTGSALVAVVVDNIPPWAAQTTPALLSATVGGDIYTTDGSVHLYFPPHAFARDVVVRIAPLEATGAPDTLPGGVHRFLPGFEISWSGADLLKTATLELAYGQSAGPGGGPPALYYRGADPDWIRIGGTTDPGGKKISAPIQAPGLYALYREPTIVSGAGGLSPLSLTPRVFSPRGTFARSDVAVGFSLGRPGPVTVKVYNRAGRLVRTVLAGTHVGAGANLVRWDGRNGDGEVVESGLYLVTVEALGETRTQTLAVAR